jgi:hypothetical protein
MWMVAVGVGNESGSPPIVERKDTRGKEKCPLDFVLLKKKLPF